MKLLLSIAVASVVLFASCGPRDPLPEPSFVYDDGYNITIAESWKGELLFQLKSNTKLNCLNYTIGNSCTVSGKDVNFVIKGVNAPATCKSGSGEALDTVALPSLAVGNYALHITNNDYEFVGSLAVTNTLYTITYTGNNGVSFATTTLNRLPANTLRGTIQVAYASHKTIADTFVNDSLKFFGASDFTGPLVSYTNFTVYGGNTYTSGNDPYIPNLYKHFIYDFSGTKTDLTKLVDRYKKKYGDTVIISMVTDGEFFGTHGNGVW